MRFLNDTVPVHEKLVLWRNPQKTADYAICDSIELWQGFIVSTSGVFAVDEDSYFSHLCVSEQPVLYTTNMFLTKMGIPRLPIFEESWTEYVDEQRTSPSLVFRDSVYPAIFVISTAAVFAVFLTAILFNKHHLRSLKPTWIMKISSLLATGQLMAIYIYSLIYLSRQHAEGHVSALELVQSITDSLGFNIVYIISYFLLLLTQIEVIKKMFSRKREQQLILVVGVSLAIISQIIWAASTLASKANSSADENVALVILPVVMYLLRISLSVLYDCLLQVYAISRKDLAFKPTVLPLTLLMELCANAAVAFYIADLANPWVSRLAEIFNITCSLLVNVVTWEWLNRMYQLDKYRQKQGVLGRQLFEETDSRYSKRFNLKPKFVKFKKSLKQKEISTTASSAYLPDEVYIYSPKQMIVPPSSLVSRPIIRGDRRRDPVVHDIRQLSQAEPELEEDSEEERLLRRIREQNEDHV
ncbi:hypothetical protein KL937_000665 [Ogataea polymorpha]|uniref:uncharacterized protein n=1 Tax=Ogataea polymorpha TaxID=460523 RepID=UPI0007F4F836|nr:uncharacterized protein OGAPODRAFT_93266 [Ogataea polymorpha]KAG7882094.1 hypothetical protein KL937_000665 [Ogataea polymorpha]KAG7937331.1 hypothetical protein KL934_001534 [Ogataea polymorpha]KAG7939724.1 hypothetical protein KL904_000662 [Ogataea polymorpha]OBA16256.1 hypothetical protein OGAPODRAFT_93266 [Ogataea polymorpha]